MTATLIALATWLAPGPAAAQAPPAGKPPAGKPPIVFSPQEAHEKTTRSALRMVGSSTMRPYTEEVIKAMLRDYELPQPEVEYKGSTDGIEKFCDGIEADTPDIVASSRAMRKDEFDTCQENHVLDIIELQIGLSALYVVGKKGAPLFDGSPRMFYYALAEQIPKDGDFVPNTIKTWQEAVKIAPNITYAAPALPIHVLIPGKGSGTRSSFEALFMEGGCRHVPEIDAIFAASERVPKCTTLREDGVVTEVPEPYGDALIAKLLEAPDGTLAVVAGDVYLRAKDKLETLPVSGVQPTPASISDFDYEMETGLYYYFKRAHMRASAGGQGVVLGIREFMAEASTEEMMGPNGFVAKLGIVPLDRKARDEQRVRVRRLVRFER